MLVNLLIVDRKTHKIKNAVRSIDWDIKVDYLSSATSDFNLVEKLEDSQIVAGDFVIVKFEGERWFPTKVSRVAIDGNPAEYMVPYFGLVDAFEDNKITCRMARDILNTTAIAYSSAKEHQVNPIFYFNVIVTRYVMRSGMYLENHVLPQMPNNNYENWSLPLEEPTSINLLDLATTLFKDIQMIYDVRYFSLETDGIIKFHWDGLYSQAMDTLNVVTSNTKKYANPTVYSRPANYGVPNAIRIQDASAAVGTYDDFYLQTDNTVVNTQTSLVSTPIIPIAYYYDSTKQSDPKPTHKDIAIQQLKTQEYQHEISFQANMDEINAETLLDAGRLINVRVKDTVYASVISSWELKSDSNWATITCGNIRTNLQTVLS